LAATFGSGHVSTTARVTTETHSALLSLLYLTVGYLQTVSGVGLVKTIISFTFTYNFTALAYDISFTSSYSVVKPFTDAVASMIMANGLTMMQLQNGSLMVHYNNQSSNAFADPRFSATNPILSLVFDNGSYFVLYSSGLAQLLVDTTGAVPSYSGSSPVAVLPNNTNHYVLGSLLNILYIPYTPYIYKGVCQGQSSNNNMDGCSSYPCSDSNCL
jgi:hypothetical protein